MAATHPDMVQRLVAIGIPHPAAWMDNMSLGQMQKSWYMAAFYAPKMPEALLPADDLKVRKRRAETLEGHSCTTERNARRLCNCLGTARRST